jgi:hypothetical protein
LGGIANCWAKAGCSDGGDEHHMRAPARFFSPPTQRRKGWGLSAKEKILPLYKTARNIPHDPARGRVILPGYLHAWNIPPGSAAFLGWKGGWVAAEAIRFCRPIRISVEPSSGGVAGAEGQRCGQPHVALLLCLWVPVPGFFVPGFLAIRD